MQKVSFKTKDGVTIVGNFLNVSDSAVLLLHMMPATKESWNDFALELKEHNLTVLAIDLRGHGESIMQGNILLDYRKFADKDHQNSIEDVDSAANFLKSAGAKNVMIVGASIGANLALQYQSMHKEISKTALLSPGTNYRGIAAEQFAARLGSLQKSFIAAGTKDARSGGRADEMAVQIASKIASKPIVKIYESDAHGTDLSIQYPELSSDIAAWLTEA